MEKKYVSKETDVNDIGTAIMGFLMGTMAIGGILFAAGFMWEIVKMFSQA